MQTTTKFVAACCAWPHTEATKARVLDAAKPLKNWDDVKQCVIRHRVIPLVHLAVKDLNEVPESFRIWAHGEAQKIAAHAMRLTHDCIKIDAALKKAGIRPLHFKGPVLGQMAYGSVALKFSHDLDILVIREHVAGAAKVLEAEGFFAERENRGLSSRQIHAVRRNFKDIKFKHHTGHIVELHWRFTNTNTLLAELIPILDRQQVTVASLAKLETLNSSQLLSYLCVHGAMHQWARLKWLAEVSAFLNQLPEKTRNSAIADVELGPNQDTLAQMLKLCDTYFGTSYAPNLSVRATTLYRFACSRIEKPFYERSRLLREIGTIKRYVNSRHLYKSPWHALWALKYTLISQADMLRFPLPPYLFWIYPIIRLPSLLIRRLRG